jgi:hypothetical protein
MTILEEAAERKAQAEQGAELARLRQHAWWPLLKNLRGTRDDASGLEYVSSGAVFDFLGVIPKRRERRLHAVLVEILQHFGWSAVFVHKDGKQTGIVRNFEREPVAQPAPPAAPPADETKCVPAPAPGVETIRLRGVEIPLDLNNEVFIAFTVDVCRTVEGNATVESVCRKWDIDQTSWQRDVVENAALDRFVQSGCEARVRNGDAATEIAQGTMPEAQKALREIITGNSAARDKIAAAKEARETAGGRASGPGIKSNFSIDITWGPDPQHGLHLKDVILYPRT